MYLETQYSPRQLSTDLFIIHIYLFLMVKVFVIKNLYYNNKFRFQVAYYFKFNLIIFFISNYNFVNGILYLETQYSPRQLSTYLFIIHIYLFLMVKVFVIKNLYYNNKLRWQVAYIFKCHFIHFLLAKYSLINIFFTSTPTIPR